jgi:hypothetical protein
LAALPIIGFSSAFFATAATGLTGRSINDSAIVTLGEADTSAAPGFVSSTLDGVPTSLRGEAFICTLESLTETGEVATVSEVGCVAADTTGEVSTGVVTFFFAAAAFNFCIVVKGADFDVAGVDLAGADLEIVDLAAADLGISDLGELLGPGCAAVLGLFSSA